MKARCVEIYEKSLSAMLAAVEIYNKPNFEYREETYSILALNSWELLIKAKWLRDHDNKLNSLYVFETMQKRDGSRGKKKVIKTTRSGNPFTHSIDYLAAKLVESGTLDNTVLSNIQALSEIRDSSIHFYHKNELFAKRLQEIGMASVKNYVTLSREWFDRDLSGYNFYLMPLAFVQVPEQMDGIVLSREEAKLFAYLQSLEGAKRGGKFDVSVSINISFARAASADAIRVQLTREPTAAKLHMTDEQLKQRWPWDYKELQKQCKARYSDFKAVDKFHGLRKSINGDERYCKTRFLDPGNPKSRKKDFYNPSILTFLDAHYTKK